MGIVTSPTGAAIRDIINVISRRTRTVHVLFSPARVQGEGAGRDIARAIKLINEHHQQAVSAKAEATIWSMCLLSAVVAVRPKTCGLSIEEEVARAIRASAIPVISAVGHETDFTIADFAADLRAATPSAAAELVAAQEDQICGALDQMGRQLSRLMRYKIADARTRVQEHALSQVFEEVRGKLRDARTAANTETHRLQILIQSVDRQGPQSRRCTRPKLSPIRIQTRFATAQARFDSGICRL